jgi:hypothetical protein
VSVGGRSIPASAIEASGLVAGADAWQEALATIRRTALAIRSGDKVAGERSK